MNKKLSFRFFWVLLGMSLFLGSCQPDSSDDPGPQPSGSINFVGTWNRDTVIVNDVAPSGLRSRLETEINFGKYTFNSDKQTGILNLSGTDFAITWNYSSSSTTVTVSEIDWINQSYQIQELSSTKLKLTGLKPVGGGFENERIMYLTKQ